MMKKRLSIIAVLTAAALTMITACDNPNGGETTAVASVTVRTDTETTARGDTLQFTADVTGTGDYSREVTWSVSGKSEAATDISANGLLTVSPSETSNLLTITAASSVSPDVKGSMTVNVIAMWYVSNQGNDSTGDGAKDAPLATVGKALTLIKAEYASTDPAWPGKGTGAEGKAYIIIEGEVTDSGAGDNTIAISSASADANEYPHIELRGRDASRPGTLRAAPGKRVLLVQHNSVTLGPNLSLTGANVTFGGCGVSVGHGGNLTIAGASITGNGGKAPYITGGGVNITNAPIAALIPGVVTMTSGTISGNTLEAESTYAAGGGVFVGNGTTFTMTGGSITGNTLIYNGTAEDAVLSGGTGVFVNGSNSPGFFELGGAARINQNNTVQLGTGSTIALIAPFTGSDIVAKIDLRAYNGDITADWKNKSVLEWSGEYSEGLYPVDRFVLGNFKGSATNPLDTSIEDASYRIDPEDGILKLVSQ
jgi:hypothetical protein